jgi:hypothetical protein
VSAPLETRWAVVATDWCWREPEDGELTLLLEVPVREITYLRRGERMIPVYIPIITGLNDHTP